MIQYTNHATVRSAQRGLSDEEIEYVFQFATRYHRGRALIYFMRNQDLPAADRCWDWAIHLVGTALIFDKDGNTLLTVWRNRRNGLKLIRRKEPYHVKYWEVSKAVTIEGGRAND